jgi:fido (protein-threonine AMPylation protein)
MSNSYKYIDPDFTYTDPETGLLRNLQDITDPEVLLFVESGAVTKRLQELYEYPKKSMVLTAFLKFTNICFKIFTFGQVKNEQLR